MTYEAILNMASAATDWARDDADPSLMEAAHGWAVMLMAMEG